MKLVTNSGAIFLLAVAAAAITPAAAALTHGSPAVSYTKRSMVIHGKPKLLLSGAIHYSRVPPSDWDSVFKTAKEMGLNCIQTYVIWNLHEHKQGNISWTGYADLPRFIALAGQNGLSVVVRIGPYICGEYYFGGIPLWMRESGAACFRCNDTVWESHMEKWVTTVVEKIRPQLASNGGPVIMLQIENEYAQDDDYLKWAVDMARNITTDVPWEICHDVPQCGQLNLEAGQDKVLCAINGFWMESGGGGGQPGPEYFDSLWESNPNQPGVWTEDQGWFDQWGVAQRIRWSNDQIYGIARFFAYGGSYHNFYMLTGGNNYVRRAGGDTVTAYAPDTVIDNLLLRHEPRYSIYAGFFHAIQAFESELLAYPPQLPVPLNLTAAGDSAPAHAAAAGGNDYNAILTTCYQYNDPHQHWVKNAVEAFGSESGNRFSLSPKSDPNMCITAAHRESAEVVNCSATDEDQIFTMLPIKGGSSGATQFATVKTYPCVGKGHNAGDMCPYCLDAEGGATVDLWSCKTGSAAENQNFALDPTTGFLVHDSNCVTASVPLPPAPNGTGAEAHVYGEMVFLSNYAEYTTGTVQYRGKAYFLLNHSLVMINVTSGDVVYNTSQGIEYYQQHDQAEMRKQQQQHQQVGGKENAFSSLSSSLASEPVLSIEITDWAFYKEVPGYGAIKAGPINGTGAAEQLLVTDNDSDYLWYSFTTTATGNISINGNGPSPDGGLRFDYGSSQAYIYIDGQLQSAPDDGATSTGSKYHKQVVLEAAAAVTAAAVGNNGVMGQKKTKRVDILNVAMGLYNGGTEPTSSKGIQHVFVGSTKITALATAWMNKGESLAIFTAKGASKVTWNPASALAANQDLVWLRGMFDLPANLASAAGVRVSFIHYFLVNSRILLESSPCQWDFQQYPLKATNFMLTWFFLVWTKIVTKGAQPNQTALVINMLGLNKGAAYVNGFNIGRYWLEPGQCTGVCAPPMHGSHCFIHWKGCGKPTQHLYHVPFEVLKATGNVLTVFEETAPQPTVTGPRDLASVKVQVLHDHPAYN